ncbi:LEAF RUST 10 DISEASE-RESISTANCE LOCUS RECEPTOR-LIKE PROTEIN KINASE-like 2.1 isoform X2 [Prunus persica]|uniref:LEAF RUST 10 DISEASE-RESISTANCE LOCUS RECEPTOR-LIKE PROTEIN KINASE-like 2.1 isoform X2 n=1 Tax=Prunus persica TaxID=3760 RepID=UPI0002C1D6BA|nr:LEAF RUST 10 DISEASE-RESISTANCE LOCUS RECEPTOR-LIKE PROTEIN KINASE-like 2.1 isoform X2 [Prunus persica]
MHPILLSPILTLLLLLFFFYSVDAATPFSSKDTQAKEIQPKETPSVCSQTFACGPLQGLSFPFTGGARPAHCGPPEFHISCVDDSPELTIMSLRYRVLELDPVHKSLRLVRSDLWNSTCTDKLANATIKSEFFAYNENDNAVVSIFYGCNSSTITPKPENWFPCNVNLSFKDSYYLIWTIPIDQIMSGVKCKIETTVPILKTAAAKLFANRSLFQEAIMEGFNVNYTHPYDDECAKCLEVNGGCGFDSHSSKPVCFCGDRVCVMSGILSGVTSAIVFIVCMVYASKKEVLFFKKYKKNEIDIQEVITNNRWMAPKRYSYSDVKKMTHWFKDQIGKGGYGTVYRGKLPDGLLVAVKVLSESKGNGEDFINEVASIGRTSHVNIVTLCGFCYERDKRALIYEFMPNGSLDNFIRKQGSEMENSRLEWKKLSEIAVGIARGLEYLHRGCNTRIVHFDIKPQNILLDKDFCPKVADFGLAKLCKTKESIVSMLGTRGTVGYIAPEVFSWNFGGVSHKCDVYSYGMLVLEMVGARKNLDSAVSHTSEMFPHYVYKDLELDKDENAFGATTEEEKQIARKMVLISLWCIQINPSDRPSMSKVVEMLEGPLHSLQIAPKPLLVSPTIAAEDSMTTSQPSEIEDSMTTSKPLRVSLRHIGI